MTRRHAFLAVGLAAVAVLIWAMPGQAFTRKELAKYDKKTMMAPDWTLKGLDGKTYKLKDYRGKQYVAIQTGSST